MASKSKLDVSAIAETATTRKKVRGSMEKGKEKNYAHEAASPEEQAERAAAMTTQGKKGCKAPRFNFRTTPKNKRYVEVMAKITGQSVAGFMNDLIDAHREGNEELYSKAVEVMAAIREDEV